ncbi:MAG: hypothetical protein ACM3ML_37145 [Micromonosporaceae bacterium]
MSDTSSHPGQSRSRPDQASSAPTIDADERAELERLRAEVRELRSQQRASARRSRFGWRTPVASLLIVLGCLLAPLSVLAVWSANQISNTDRYVANMAPLVTEPAVQNALTDKITNQITSNLNVAALATQAGDTLSSKGLPRAGELLKTFAPSLASAVQGFVHNTVHKVVTSPEFARAWTQANTVAHAEMVKVLSGRGGGAVSVQNGQVTIDLAPFIDIVKKDLANRGFTLVNSLPAIHPTVALFSARELVKAQSAYRLINALKWVLPILALLLLAGGVYVARGHRRALIGAGLGLAASMLVLGAALALFRGVYLNSVPARVLPADAAAVLFDTVVRFIRDGLRLLLVVGLVVALGAFFTGPSATAVRTRRAFTSGLGWLRESGERAGLRTGPVGRWTYAHRTGLRIGAVALAALIFVFWGRPTVAVVIGIVVVLLVVLGLIELIGRPTAQHATAGPPDSG